MNIGEIIRLTISENAFSAISYMAVTTLTIIIMIIVSVQKKNKYMRLKKQTLNFLNIYKKEWELSGDDFTKQLWDDNERLEKEVKVLKKEFNKLSFVAFIFGILLLIPYFLKEKLKKNENEILTTDSESLRKDEILKFNDDRNDRNDERPNP